MTTCSICLENLANSPCVKLNCHHVFHRLCASQWLWTNTVCPLCRKDHSVESIYSIIHGPDFIVSSDNTTVISRTEILSCLDLNKVFGKK